MDCFTGAKCIYGQTTKAPAVPSEPEASGVGDERGGGLDCFTVFHYNQNGACFLHFGERVTILKEIKKLDMCVPMVQAGAEEGLSLKLESITSNEVL